MQNIVQPTPTPNDKAAAMATTSVRDSPNTGIAEEEEEEDLQVIELSPRSGGIGAKTRANGVLGATTTTATGNGASHERDDLSLQLGVSGATTGAAATASASDNSNMFVQHKMVPIPQSSYNILRARRGVIRMLIVVVLTFALCNLPFHARKIWQYW